MTPTALLYALQVLQALPSLLAAGQNVVDLVTTSNAKLKAMVDEKRNPTDDEWEELNDSIDELREQLHAP